MAREEAVTGAVDPSIEGWLSAATFTPIHDAWLPEREAQLTRRLAALPVRRPRRVMLLNATLGRQLYPSVVDFFATLQRVHPSLRATSASHFPEISELEEGVAAKGLTVVPMSEVALWSEADFNRFDVVIAVGASQTLARLMAIQGLRARLVCLDLAFYHQLLQVTGGAFYRRENVALVPRATQKHMVVCYSCQPRQKITVDLSSAGFAVRRFAWRWFDYIPLGFSHRRDYRASARPFDVALLGDSGRDYGLLEPATLRGRRVLFLGTIGRAPELERMRATLDLTVVSRLDEDNYARMLALCRCVVLPMRVARRRHGLNVVLSVLDALASGTPLVTNWHRGIARLLQSATPIVATRRPPLPLFPSLWNIPGRLSSAIDGLLGDEHERRNVGGRSIDFARARLDIYTLLELVLAEQVL
jgi:hypothetical protein